MGSDSLGSDCEVFEDKALRCVKICCPFLCRSNIDIDVICNGCIITAEPKPPQGSEIAPWMKQIQFRPSEGLCEFKGASFEGDFLKIEFQRSRVHRLRSFSVTDAEDESDLFITDAPDATSDDSWTLSGETDNPNLISTSASNDRT